jgi:predicted esterase
VWLHPKHLYKEILMKGYFRLIGTVIGLFSVLSCSTSPHQFTLPRSTQATVTKAHEKGFRLVRYKATPFVLTAYERLQPGQSSEQTGQSSEQTGQSSEQTGQSSQRAPQRGLSPIHVYIEGDGNSWVTKYQLSDNPTPRQPMALRLALLDPHPNVIYLARACQYTPPELNPSCTDQYWSSHRYAAEVIKAMNDVLSQIKTKTKNTEFVLIGFSGGASVAALLASQRSDVRGLITVAGDLDHERLNQHHRTTPLKGSLNPFAIAPKLKTLPQDHWSGTKDKVVPVWIAEQFVQKVNNPDCAASHTLKNATHHRKWEDNWSKILQQYFSKRVPECKRSTPK